MVALPVVPARALDLVGQACMHKPLPEIVQDVPGNINGKRVSLHAGMTGNRGNSPFAHSFCVTRGEETDRIYPWTAEAFFSVNRNAAPCSR